MKKTVDLPDQLKKDLEEVARSTARPEAAVIRGVISSVTRGAISLGPRVPLTRRGLGDPTVAESVDNLLDKFGR